MDLKQNAFLRQWISPHQHHKNSANERKSNLFESFTASVAYFRTGKYIHFFTINAPLEYYFFLYKVFSILYGGEKKKDDFSYPHQCSFTKLFLQSHHRRYSYIFNLGYIHKQKAKKFSDLTFLEVYYCKHLFFVLSLQH